ncbi:hypothetical protein KFE25_008706 [Diacronema lutheri]|uniref:Charged multivesicular body protein 6 n=1 Tax=Diacronema lutheri TaxID=2081491 RepID=A0A8J6CHJ5_DIALT|nr:hypothetical protein KFE25_008706 [Diacronema lutheri]
MLTLKVTKNRVGKHRTGILRSIELEGASAREHAAHGNRQSARDALRRRRYWEQVLGKTEAMLLQLDEVIAGIELAQLNKVVYSGLAAGTAALKRMQADLPLEKVERLMDERADALAMMDEVDAALGTGHDAELDEELGALEAENVNAQLPAAPAVAVPQTLAADAADAALDAADADLASSLPSAPTSVPGFERANGRALRERTALSVPG